MGIANRIKKALTVLTEPEKPDPRDPNVNPKQIGRTTRITARKIGSGSVRVDDKIRRIELVNAETGDTYFYEEVFDDAGENFLHANGDTRLKELLETIVELSPMDDDTAMHDERIQNAVANAIKAITGEEFSPSRGFHSRPSTEGWTKRTLN